MKRVDLVAALRNNDCPPYMQHLFMAMYDDIKGLKDNMLEAHNVINELAKLIELSTNVTAGFTKDIEHVKKKLGVTVQSEEVEANPGNIIGAGGA